jgi:hypothetical protein
MHIFNERPKYRRVISLEIQVGITSQINIWANTDPQTHRRRDQVPRRSKHPLLTGHTRREPSSIIMNAELSTSKAVCQVRSNYWYEECHTTYGSMTVCNYEFDHCNGRSTCDTKRDCRNPCIINLSVSSVLRLKTDRM